MGLLGDIISGGIGIANYRRQQEHYDYEKQLVQQQWARDDNAVQRRRADLEAAGMNPVLAAGDAAANSTPIQTSAPQMDQSLANMLDFDGMALNLLTNIGNVRKQQLDLKAQAQQIAHAEENFKLDNLAKVYRNRAFEQQFELTDYYLSELYPSQKSLNEAYGKYYNNQASELWHDLQFRQDVLKRHGIYLPKNTPSEALNLLLGESALNKLSQGLDLKGFDLSGVPSVDSITSTIEKNLNSVLEKLFPHSGYRTHESSSGRRHGGSGTMGDSNTYEFDFWKPLRDFWNETSKPWYFTW